MGVVPHGKEPGSHREAQVVFVELDECRAELRGSTHAPCKGVRLELKPAAQDSQTEGQDLEVRMGEMSVFLSGL